MNHMCFNLKVRNILSSITDIIYINNILRNLRETLSADFMKSFLSGGMVGI